MSSENEEDLSEEGILACFICSKSLATDKEIRQGLCLNCMAYIIQNLDITPDGDYPIFIDFAYEVKNRLELGEAVESALKNIPEGFGKWLINNYTKTGFGLVSP